MGIAVVTAVLGLGVATFVWSSLRSVAQVQEDVAEMAASLQGRSLEELTAPDSYAALINRIQEIEARLEELRRSGQAARVLGWVPGAGPKAKEAAAFLEMSSRLAHGARLTLQGYTPAVQALNAGGPGLDTDSLRQALASAEPLFVEAQEDLAAAKRLRAQLQAPELLGERGQAYVAMIDQYLPLLEVAVVVAQDAPHMVGDALALRQTVGELRVSFSDPSALLSRPQETEARFQEVEARARSLQASLVTVKSNVQGGDARVDQALDAALGLSALLAEMGETLGRFSALSDRTLALGPMTPEAGALLGQELPALRERLQLAQSQLESVQSAFSQQGNAASAMLSLMGGALGSTTAPLQREESLLATGTQSLDFLFYLLGYDAPRKFLLIGQNSDEIRATGGFLGVVVEMDIDRGELKALRYQDSDGVDSPTYETNPIAPEPIFRYLWMSRFLFRDANWNPHFPASATQVADLYQRGQGVEVDGVIAATDDLVLDLVAALGGIRVPELPGLLDRATAERYVKGILTYPCLPRHASKRNKRCFDEDLFRAVIQRLFSPMDAQVRPQMVGALLSALGSKDILVHVFDQQAAELLWQHNWNGALQQVDHDYLMIVDSSLPGHARSVVERRVQYQVTLDPRQPIQSQLLISYQHKGTVADPNCRQDQPKPTGCYWNYLRVYVPVLADDIQVPPVPLPEGSDWLIWGYEPADSLSIISSPQGGLSGFTEIGGYLPAEPGQSVTLPISYRLPASRLRAIGNGVYEYRLLMQKQPGTPVEPVSLFVQLPQGARLVKSLPAPSAQQGDWVRIDVDLTGDVTFVVDFQV